MPRIDRALAVDPPRHPIRPNQHPATIQIACPAQLAGDSMDGHRLPPACQKKIASPERRVSAAESFGRCFMTCVERRRFPGALAKEANTAHQRDTASSLTGYGANSPPKENLGATALSPLILAR